jgi:hypothetical protein
MSKTFSTQRRQSGIPVLFIRVLREVLKRGNFSLLAMRRMDNLLEAHI